MPGDHCEISVDEQNNDNNKKTTTRRKKKKKKQNDVDFEKGNQFVMPSILKTRNRFIPKIRKKPKSPKRCSSSSSHSGSPKGGCFCVMRSLKTKESSSSSSPSSDPNDESFTHEMLRVMLETNDFYSSECNPHR